MLKQILKLLLTDVLVGKTKTGAENTFTARNAPTYRPKQILI